jgi:Leucine-rich repeat (LRR) protein
LAGLSELRHLKISGNDLLHSPPILEGLENLQELEILYNGMDSLPSFNRLSGLRQLELGFNRELRSRPSLEGLESLQQLGLYGDVGPQFFPSLAGLTGLQQLTIEYNGVLRSLPSFEGLSRLQQLSISSMNELIPTALIADRYGPLAMGDRVEAVRHGHERVPSLATGRDDGVVVGPDTQA